jgi:hypothetical protein
MTKRQLINDLHSFSIGDSEYMVNNESLAEDFTKQIFQAG